MPPFWQGLGSHLSSFSSFTVAEAASVDSLLPLLGNSPLPLPSSVNKQRLKVAFISTGVVSRYLERLRETETLIEKNRVLSNSKNAELN